MNTNYHDMAEARKARESKGEVPAAPAPKTIDITPTWASILPAYCAALMGGNSEGRKIAFTELTRMAQAADNWNRAAKGTASFTATSTNQMKYMVAHIASLSCWFEVTPLPDDQYEITVKRDVAHIAFPIDTKG